MKSLQELLGYVPMTTLAVSVVGGIKDKLPAAFSVANGRNVVGNAVQYNKVIGHRQTALAVHYGNAAHDVQTDQKAQATATMFHTFESFNINPLLLQNLYGMNGEGPQDVARDQLGFDLKEMLRRPANLRIAARYSALCNGKIWFDGPGNILTSSSGATVTIDYGVPAANQGQLGGLIDTSWANSAAHIPTQINNVIDYLEGATGYSLTNAIYGKNILKYVMNDNDSVNLIKANPILQNVAYKQGRIPDGFCGLNWTYGHSIYFVDKNGNVNRPVGDDQVIFTPDPSPEWWENVQGSMMVPTTVELKDSILESLNSFQTVYGPFAYGKEISNPPTVQQFWGDTYLPLLKVPGVVLQPTVAF